MKVPPIPETGGSWSRDPKTGALTLIEEPTVHPVPEAAPDAAARSISQPLAEPITAPSKPQPKD